MLVAKELPLEAGLARSHHLWRWAVEEPVPLNVIEDSQKPRLSCSPDALGTPGRGDGGPWSVSSPLPSSWFGPMGVGQMPL